MYDHSRMKAMKRVYGIVLFLSLLLAGQTNALALTATMSVQNVSVSGDTVCFDLYLKNTSVDPLYLTDASFYLNFNGNMFNSASATVETDLSGSSYDASVSVYNTTPRTLGVEYVFLQTPNTTNTEEISTNGDGTKLGTVCIIGVDDFTQDMDLDWASGLFTSITFAYNPGTNQDEEVTLFASSIDSPLYVGPQYTATVTNQQLLSGEYTFDVYMMRTGGTDDMYLDDCDIVIEIPNLGTKFAAPTFSVESRGSSKLDTYYSFSTSISGDYLQLAIEVPPSTTISSQSDLDTKLEKISGTGEGTLIGTMKVSNASTTDVFAINPDWGFTFPNETLILRRRAQAPYTYSDDITDAGTFSVDAPEFSVTVAAPNGGEEFCPGGSTDIMWNSLNVSNVDITLLDGGVTTATIATNVNALDGTYTWNIPNGFVAGDYSIRVSDSGTPARNDDSDATFAVLETIAITDQPVGTTVCEGADVMLSVTATGSNPTYQWQYEGSDLTGETGSTLTLTGITAVQDGAYTVIVSNSCGDVTSDVASVVVQTAPAITGNPSDATVTEFEMASFTVSATGTGLSYQWQYSTNNSVFADIAGATNATYDIAITELTDAGYYRAVVSGTCPTAVTSASAQLTVIPVATQFDVTAYFGGYYDGISGTHKRLPIIVELRSGMDLASSTLVDRTSAIVSTMGTVSVNFNALQSGDYWLVLRSGGALPVASNGMLTVAAGGTVSYNFTDQADRAYPGVGTTVEEPGGAYTVRMADLNGDRAVNATDFLFYFLPNFSLVNPGQVPAID